MYTHYASYSLDGTRLLNVGKKIARDMEDILNTDDRVALAFRGLSGTTLASAVLIETRRLNRELGAIYVRKTGEESHGHHVEYGIPWSLFKLRTIIFIDDFIDSGETLQSVYEEIVADLQRMKESYSQPDDVFHHLNWGLCTVEDEPPISSCANGFNVSFAKYRLGPYI